MEVSMSKTRRGKYTDNRICYISKCKGDMRLYLRRKGKLPCFSYLVRGKSFSFYRGKIRFYIEKAIFLFNFYDKSLEVSILLLIFATNSVSPFVWVSGLFTGKGRYGTLSLSLKSRKFEYAQEENDNWKRPRRVYCNLTCRGVLLLDSNSVFCMSVYYNAS